ncbi:50S ribosomal protein L21 [candidate division NPL-UPA2 bacterium Unc8]|uniref:Large ribosomal subunit protein bL21 n=1 Tax=candidate division NPL-UPA2 bacterium Unc8 TaxID=1980939 RepID=A0A399FYR2_UNCN2|nr:50S ribosomal protein L21 [Bacillota bacterium]MBT9138797.1 50S ribosomal protein L21 [Bacillota bacterium]MBT9146669.1 50S ribosomal protein L21 [Bacillota bacterium]RII00382.1 MAG: 50S ribosomal protein L21 [candidate division NPL-UPA2 bacterium Unc8]
MYAVIRIGGEQHLVRNEDVIQARKMTFAEGEKIKIDDVLLLCDGDEVSVGRPNLQGVSVDAEVRGHGKEKKIVVFKKKRRKGYSRKTGHRQQFTEIKILKIKGEVKDGS